MLKEMGASDRFKKTIMYQVQVLPQMRSLLAYKQFQYLLGANKEVSCFICSVCSGPRAVIDEPVDNGNRHTKTTIPRSR